MQKLHAWPEGHWNWPINISHKHGVRRGNMIWVGGQVSLDRQGRAVHPGNLGAQIRQAMAHARTILNELGADYADVCKVLALYQGDCGKRP